MKVGYCVCCSYITHVAVPPNYTAGPYVGEEGMGITLWQSQGPWAGRYLAARQFLNWRGNLPAHWDRDARSLDIPTPQPLLFSLAQERASGAAPEMKAPCRPPPVLLGGPPRRPRYELHAEPVASKPSPPRPASSRDLTEFEVEDTSPSRKRVQL